MCQGLRQLLVTGLFAVDYAQLIYRDEEDVGLTMVFRITNANANSPKAYHYVQPTLRCGDKRGVLFE